jgi:phospholipase C
MSKVKYRAVVWCLSSISLVLSGCGGGASSSSVSPSGSVQLSVQAAGAGAGMISSNPAGINCGAACSASFVEGTQVTLTAAPMGNSFFAGWAGACSGSAVCKVTLTANASVTATFDTSPVLAVTLGGTGKGSVATNPSGINCGQTCSASFNAWTQITLTATAAANSYFVGWAGGCRGNSPTCTLTLSANQQVTATFDTIQNAPVLTVNLAGNGLGTISSNPSGINCGSTCRASLNAGTQVTLTATAAKSSYFVGWEGGGCSGDNPTCTLTLSASQQVTATFNTISNAPVLTVSLAGNGSGTVSSSPPGINCEPTCSASFNAGTQVTLTATPATNSFFVGWAGACSGNNSTCTLTLSASQQVSATFNTSGIAVLNHIIFLAQENRGFDHYFGAMREYWAQNGYPDQSFDGLPQFNPVSGPPPLYGPPLAIPGCDPTMPPPKDCIFDPNNPITSYHLITQCTENTSPSWNESHVDWDYYDPVGNQPAALNGVVWTAAHDARAINPPFNDTDGIRAMGYYDGGDLNYYYFMASNFATSDRWFNPAMTRTHPNREYLIAGTSQGYAYPIGTDSHDKALLTATTIFQELQDAGVSWKIYVNPTGSKCSGPPYDLACLLTLSYVQNFQWGQTIPAQYPQNIGTIGVADSDFDNDLQNGTLPQVAQIEPASDAGLDEHPSNSDLSPSNIQLGAKYVSSIMNGLMASTSWKDSAFILTYDEFGGLYDHVPPEQAVSPDGIKPVDLLPGDICTQATGPICDFVYTGYRLPLVVVSPYTKKNYVSHTAADTTAILKLIETRFNLSPLTQRDAAQMDMTEFFDFDNPAWMTPPQLPVQATNGACYLNKLP